MPSAEQLWLASAGGLAAALAWLALLLPRLKRRHFTISTFAAALAIAVAAAFWPAAGPALLVAACAMVAGWVGTTLRPVRADDVPEAVTSRPAASEPSTPAAAMLGRYRLEGELGRGAMGVVYLGRDPQIGRPVALKTLALGREFEGEHLAEARERFFREAESAGRLQHPDIVTIYDAGEAGELAYIAMELLRGHDLGQHVTVGRLLPVPQVLHIVARVADALAYAHAQGVVHRDIKPANVMIDAAAGSVKVTDFGVARIADAARTRTGIVVGTPSYMSPEQMAGRRIDGRSDLYSLGVMLFQLLTGALPHEGDSMARLMYRIANEPAPDVRSLRPDLPAALADVVALALEKRPEVRYADGRQIAEDLRAIAALADPGPDVDKFRAGASLASSDPRHNSAR